MGLKVCISPGCWQPTHGTRCVGCEAVHQHQRNQDPRRRGRPYYRRLAIPTDAICACCGTAADLTRHHVVPLATPNGRLAGSWIPMCRSCNGSIGANVMASTACPKHGGTVA